MLNKLLFSKENAEVDGWGKIPPSYVFISNIDDEVGNIVRFKIAEGYVLPTFGIAHILAVGSIMVIEKQKSPVNLYGHLIKHGTIKVVSKGLELQSGTEILMTH